MILSRLSNNSYSLQEFNKTIPEYQLALEKSRYKEKLTYIKEEPKQTDQFYSTSKKQKTDQERLFGSTLLSMMKSTLILAIQFNSIQFIYLGFFTKQ